MKKNKIKLFKIYSISIILIIIIFVLLIGVIKYFFIYSEAKENYNTTISKIEREENSKSEINKLKEKYALKEEVEKNILENNMLQRPGEKIIEIVE